MNDFKQQLAPGWSAVNLVITALLFMMGLWPLSLIMIAYIVWGSKVGLDLSRPQTVSAFIRRISVAVKAGLDSFSKG